MEAAPPEAAAPSQGHPGEPTGDPANEPSRSQEVSGSAEAVGEARPLAPPAPAEVGTPVE